MARNEEKAQSMLYRFREAQMEELGIKPRVHLKPRDPMRINNLRVCEKWRLNVIKEIGQKVVKIQDITLDDYAVRDLNDSINKLIREKAQWEERIVQVGGSDYKRLASSIISEDAVEIGGYKYFGRAKNLPGVKDMFKSEVSARDELKRISLAEKTSGEMQRNANVQYYGYLDEDDGVLLAYEREVSKRWMREAGLDPTELDEAPAATYQDYFVHGLPSQEEIEQHLLELKKAELLAKYGS